MNTTGATETLVLIYQTTRLHIPQNNDHHCYWHKNIKFLMKIFYRVLFEQFKPRFCDMTLFWKRRSNFISYSVLMTQVFTVTQLHSFCVKLQWTQTTIRYVLLRTIFFFLSSPCLCGYVLPRTPLNSIWISSRKKINFKLLKIRTGSRGLMKLDIRSIYHYSIICTWITDHSGRTV
jgi:hypothetical protein